MLLQRGRFAAHAAFLFSAYVLEATFVFAFNLDTDQVLRKDGEPGSLFGFSLAMHRQLNPDKAIMKRVRAEQFWKKLLHRHDVSLAQAAKLCGHTVLIGAPRARALSNQKANITGGLYKCEVTQSNDCTRIIFDNDVDLTTENKENQWMGVSVKSQGPGGKIVTCAHRYQKRWHVNTAQETHYIPGRCYILGQDLTIDPQSSEDGGNWKFCDGRPESHSMFGTCQQGLAATFTKDYHYMVFGAVGAYNWKGVARVEQNNSTFLDMGIYDDGPFEVGSEQVRNPEFVPVPANSYLGFSLDSGHHITTRGNLTVVAGAPRASHSGAVVLFKKDVVAGNLSTEYILHGQGLASCFGYDVAVVDLNNDGWQDIVIGAPQFYMKGKDIGGAVYVYINEAGVWEGITPVRLNGNKDSMFGVAVENIGDINQDSYKDIAIGAPQEDSGTGKVYIYHGSSQGIKTTPAQILSGKDHNIRFFGYSLAGNMDLDGNSYPDLAVGSLSDSAIIYRTRPVISLNSVVKVSPNEISLNKKTCGDSVCFTVMACFSYKANPASYNPKLTISYVVEADRAHRRGLTSRAMFLNDSSSELEYQFNGTLNLKEQNQQKCVNLIARLKDNIKDKMRSIPIEVSADISTKQGGKKNGLPLMIPILDATQPSKVISEVNFVKEGCGSDHICQSNLKMEYSLHYKQANQEYPPLSKSKNNIPEFIVNYEKKDLAVLVTVSNMNGDDAYETKLVGTFPNSMSYSGVRSDQTTMENPITCVANVNSSQADCELGNPFKRNSKATFKVILSAAHLTFDTTEIEIDLQLNTTSYQEAIHVKVKCKVIIEWPLSVSGNANPTQVFFGGVVRGESAMKSEEEIGSLINFSFTINNLWKHLKPSFETSLNIYWPQIHKNGKWLLYLMSITSEGPEKINCSPKTEINPLNIAQQSSVSRTKREIMKGERKTGGKTSSLQDKKSVFSCEDGMSKCVVFKCPLQGLDGTVVVLRSRLWNSTFIEEYASRSTLQLSVKATLEFDTRRENVILTNQNTTVSVNVSPDNEAAKHQGVPWWIILVAVLIGVLILILLVYLLWKCGFFRRPSKDQYNAAYQKAEINIQPSEKDKLSAED